MLLEISIRIPPGWLINSNRIMQSGGSMDERVNCEEQGGGEEEESSGGGRGKIMRNIPIRGHLCSTLPVVHPPSTFLLLFFLHSRPFIRRPQYRQERHPLARGGPSRLFHCATFAQGLLEIRASDFSPFFFNAFPSLFLSFSPSSLSPLPSFLSWCPCDRSSNEESRRDIG